MKDDSLKSYFSKVNKVVSLLNRQGGQSLTITDLADMASLSPYHFHRIFTQLMGEPLGQFARRYRLEKGAFLLRYSTTDLSQIARQTGYSSSDSFTKAFRKQFAVLPKTYRFVHQASSAETAEASGQLNPRIWTMIEQGRLVHRPSQALLCLRGKGFTDGNFNQVANQVWPRLLTYARRHHLLTDQTQYLTQFPQCTAITQPQQCHYEACLSLPINRLVVNESEFEVSQEQAGRFMVFTHQDGYERLWESWSAIHRYWLPFNQHVLRRAAALEVYPHAKGFRARQPTPVELYLPIE